MASTLKPRLADKHHLLRGLQSDHNERHIPLLFNSCILLDTSRTLHMLQYWCYMQDNYNQVDE